MRHHLLIGLAVEIIVKKDAWKSSLVLFLKRAATTGDPPSYVFKDIESTTLSPAAPTHITIQVSRIFTLQQSMRCSAIGHRAESM
jgi:hypothetical protein